ncbi:MAG: 2-C-methyl-D-erythritol 2,4-cyclodiphosphate synthase [Synergistaceae bacterium]|jgi:2-C-methyl-D-erythritol 4-phosphate cytidylyltransferase/2-C-methyl-D-erythritol 2,4-cyclodiphosphate synthase|nr:2-C-methyl-D-erythritol 2,4-cyclodiphosphate synthase [Synergistaceae bacterium]
MKPEDRTWSFVLAAAGGGRRLGGTPKQFRKLGGEDVWRWSAKAADELFRRGIIDELVLVFPEGHEPGHSCKDLSVPVKYALGGRTRTESVRNGVSSASGRFVMIHDAARPFLPVEMCEALASAVTGDAGAVPLLESTDSLKLVDGDMTVLPREKIFRTQTPQAFERASILALLESSGESTDEASLWLDAEKKLSWVRGSQKNFKITTDFDWTAAVSLVGNSRVSRVGIGYDRHELVPGRRLVLGGVAFDSPLGLLGHSDADVVCHAVSDALLGAAGEGDIGAMFPASDERYRGADSTELLTRVLKLISSKGWSVCNVDAALVAQTPRLGGGMKRVSENLKTLLTAVCPYAELGVKVKSGEKVGSTGRAECMECFASALIERYNI